MWLNAAALRWRRSRLLPASRSSHVSAAKGRPLLILLLLLPRSWLGSRGFPMALGATFCHFVSLLALAMTWPSFRKNFSTRTWHFCRSVSWTFPPGRPGRPRYRSEGPLPTAPYLLGCKRIPAGSVDACLFLLHSRCHCSRLRLMSTLSGRIKLTCLSCLATRALPSSLTTLSFFARC